jgi:hypothetical protein
MGTGLRDALREAAPLLCTSGNDSDACSLVRRFSKARLPVFPMGKRLTVGRVLMADGKAGEPREGVLILWSFREEDYPMVRLFDPEPANAAELEDALAVAANIRAGAPIPDNGFSRYLVKVSKGVDLRQAYPAENALWFLGTETVKVTRAHTTVEYFIRQDTDSYLVLSILREEGSPPRYGIAELPGPTLSIPAQ